MLTLLLLRHAKAEPGGSTDDFERRLTDKGRADAERLGRHLKRIDHVPDAAMVSAARRTVETFEIVAGGTGIPAAREPRLYNATPAQIRDAVAGAAEGTRRLMVVGHNPGLMEAATALAGEGDLPDLERLRGRFPPCGLAVLTFRGEEWDAVRPGAGRLEFVVMPEDLLEKR